jgi:DNA sulfur modification protein DndD
VILHSLTLENVGPYAGRQTFDFADDRKRPVTLIGGLNGAGKTTIIHSLFHVLYGARCVSALAPRRSYGAFLLERIHSEREAAAIELALTIPGVRDEVLMVRRQWRKGARSTSDDLDVFVGGSYDEGLSECWDEIIEQLAPLAIARLFFFDGEKIEALADLESAATSLRTAVGSLLGLDLVEQLRTDLVAVQRRALRTSDAAASAALDAHQVELVGAEELAATIRRGVEELDRSLAEAQEDHRQLRQALGAAGGDLVPERVSLEAELEAARAAEGARWEELRGLASEAVGPLTLVANLLDALGATVRAREASGSERGLLTLLEERDRWLVAELKRLGVEPTSKIARSLAADRRRRATEAVTGGAFVPRVSLAYLEGLSTEHLTNWRTHALASLDALDKDVGATDELDRRISRIPSPDSVRVLLDAVSESEDRVSELHGELEEQRQLLKAAEAQVLRARGKRDAELTHIAEAEDDHERQQRVIRHAELAKTTLARLQTRIAERHVSRIADYAEQCLGQLLRKERLIGRVAIDPETFALSLWDCDDRELRAEVLSAGERQLTALALLWALARAAGRPLPVVIDTPLGRLDAGHRRHVVERYMPAASHQVVVLSTDTEIDSELHELLAPSVGVEYHLVNDAEGRTSVAQGYLELSAT